jgi:multiple sugar transport system ATP-binding protein
MADIVLEHVAKRFGDFTAVRGSTFTIRDGEFFMLLGPSGCGKTTTLRMIAGLELPTSGRILLDGEDVSLKRASQRDVAFVFQMFALYPHLTVYGNIAYPLRAQGAGRAETRARVAEVAATLRIAHLLDRPVGGLSGGDRQRVALGRAIVRRPKAFMMDEPLGALDAEFRELMAHELRALHGRIAATTVYVTHDQLEAMQMGDRIAVMNHGVVEQVGTPQQIYDRPASMFVADFIGSPAMNFLPLDAPPAAGAAAVRVAGAETPIPRLTEAAPGPAILGVRPEHVTLDDAAPLRAEVFETEYLGATQIVVLRTEAATLKARLPAAAPVRPGERTGLRFATERLSLFDAACGRALALEAAHG